MRYEPKGWIEAMVVLVIPWVIGVGVTLGWILKGVWGLLR